LSRASGIDQKYEEVMRLALERGFFHPASEIYSDAPAGFWDYGPLGVSLKRKFIQLWRRELVRRDNMIEIDGAQVLSRNVFVASGHLKSFVDPIAKCPICNSVYRIDKLIEETVGLHIPERLDLDKIKEIVKENNIRCSKCRGELTEFSYFNMMFKLEIGATGIDAYLRPETCQSIFVDFLRLFKVMRCKLPIGFAQIGKSFRNEISPRQGLIRMREFYQAEIEVFFNPKKANNIPKAEPLMDYVLRLQPIDSDKILEITCQEALKRELISSSLVAYYLSLIQLFYEKAGIPRDKIRLRQLGEDERAFYAIEAWDLEVETSLGWIELVACNNRGDYDLGGHQRISGQEMVVLDDGEKVLPHVFELSMGIDRSIYCILETAYGSINGRNVLKINPELAPIHAAVLPLVSREPLISRAREIYDLLRIDYDILYDESGSIGRRYARQDEVGTPYCITIDNQTLIDDTVTIRHRDTTHQFRIEVSKLHDFLSRSFRIN